MPDMGGKSAKCQEQMGTKTVQGLLNIIARIENHIDRHEELAVSLQQENSEYQLVDSKFRRITRKRWISLTSSQSASRSIFIRLIKVPTTDKLNVAYAENIFLAERGYAWDIVTHRAEEIQLQKDLNAARRRRHSLNHLMQIELRLKTVRKQLDHATHIRNLRRLLLCVVRYHLIDPHGLLWAKDERWLRERAPPKPKAAVDHREDKSSVKKHGDELVSKQLATTVQKKTKDQRHPTTMESRHPSALIHSALQELQSQGLQRRKAADDVVFPQARARKSLMKAPIGSMDRALTTPQRSMTSRSLQLVKDPKLFPFRRSKTFTAKDLDLEAQNAAIPTVQRVTFATATQPSWRAPTYVIVSDSLDRDVQSSSPPIQNRPKPAHIFRRRVSTSESRNAGPVTLSPRRLPLHMWQGQVRHHDDAVFVKDSVAQSGGLKIVTQPPELAPSVDFSRIVGGHISAQKDENTIRNHITDVRKQKDMKSLRPFFLWKGALAATPLTPRESNAGIVFGGSQEEDEATLNGSVSPLPELESTKDLLDILNLGLERDHYVSEDFPVKNEHYNTANPSTIWAVADDLNRQTEINDLVDQGQHDEIAALLSTKTSIVLRVDAIIRCFVDESFEGEAILGKTWGIVAKLNELSLNEVGPRPS